MTRAAVTGDPDRGPARPPGGAHLERSSVGPDPAAVAQGAAGGLRRSPGILDWPFGLHDDAAAPFNETLDVAPDVLPLRIPSKGSNGAWPIGVSPGRIHRRAPRRARLGPRLSAGAVLGGNRAVHPSSALVPTRGHGLALTVWSNGRSVVVSVSGEIDVATTAQLSEALSAALRAGVERLVCDLTDVGFLDASGVRALRIAGRRAGACYAWLDLVCTQSLPRKVVRLTGLDTVMPCHDSVAEAVEAQEQRSGRPGLTAFVGGN